MWFFFSRVVEAAGAGVEGAFPDNPLELMLPPNAGGAAGASVAIAK